MIRSPVNPASGLSRRWYGTRRLDRLDENLGAQLLAMTTADEHLASALPYLAGDYMGEHWLVSFALLAMVTEPKH